MIDTPDDILPGMAATIGVAIVAARGVGRPEPEETDLYLPLVAAGFTAPEIRDHLAEARLMAMDALRATVEGVALALFLGAVWIGLVAFAGA